MQCPSCLRELARHRTPQGYVWACSGCHGRSLTMPVLRKSGARPEFINELWQQARSSNSKGIRACPHCGRLMPQVRQEMLSDTLVLDVCCTCRAIWFDRGEYEATPRRPAVAAGVAEGEMSREARQQLAVLEVQRSAAQNDASAGQYGPEESWQWIPALMGMPIEIDAPPMAQKPWLTWSLVAACVLTFLLQLSVPDSGLIRDWGFKPGAWERHGLLTLFTSFFLHASVFHLFGNMWALWVFGDNVEDRLGPLYYGAMLLFGHLAGMVLHAGFDGRADVPCVGASAGISSVIAFYAICFPKVRLGFVIWFRWFRISAGWAIIFYAVMQLIGTLQQVGGLSRVSYLGHLGGLVVGVCTAGIYLAQRRGERPGSPPSVKNL